jgi:hypothetical protein
MSLELATVAADQTTEHADETWDGTAVGYQLASLGLASWILLVGDQSLR